MRPGNDDPLNQYVLVFLEIASWGRGEEGVELGEPGDVFLESHSGFELPELPEVLPALGVRGVLQNLALLLFR